MQPKTILSVLSIAIAASARPSPQSTTPSCSPTQVLACCDGIATNGTGLGCIFSSIFPLFGYVFNELQLTELTSF